VTGNENQTDKVYLNNGTADPFSSGTLGMPISSDEYPSLAILAGDIDGNGEVYVVVGTDGQVNQYYRRIRYDVGSNMVMSLEVDSEPSNISNAAFDAVTIEPIHTSIDFFLSNNGGANFFQVYSGQTFLFPTIGNDLRWKAYLHSLSPALTPSSTPAKRSAVPLFKYNLLI